MLKYSTMLVHSLLLLEKTFLYSVANYEVKSQRFLAMGKFKENHTNQFFVHAEVSFNLESCETFAV
jgi:hypothetical protein